MRKKLTAAGMAGLLLLMTGCQATPDKAVVEKKGGADKYAASEAADSSVLREELEVPEVYKNSLKDSSTALSVSIDDPDIVIPAAASMAVKTAVNKEFTAADIARFTEVLLGDAILYETRTYYDQYTREECEDMLLKLRQWKSEGNYDPYDMGQRDDGELVFDIDAEIEFWEETYLTASDEAVGTEVSRIPGENFSYVGNPETGTYDGTKRVNQYFVTGVASPDNDRTYQFGAGTYKDDETGEYPVLEEFRSFLAMNQDYGLITYNFDPVTIYSDTDELDFQSLKMTEEEAIAAGDELIEELQLEGLEFSHIEYYVNYHNNTASHYREPVYGLSYIRTEDGVPFTYTREDGSSLESMDTFDLPWPFEYCLILLDDDGLIKLEYVNPLVIEDTVAGQVELLKFQEVADIFETMILIQYGSYLEEYARTEIDITEIKLGYMRVLDPENRDTGLIIPVWDFFGTIATSYEDEEYNQLSTDPYRSLLTINAVDGTIIDRGLGY